MGTLHLRERFDSGKEGAAPPVVRRLLARRYLQCGAEHQILMIRVRVRSEQRLSHLVQRVRRGDAPNSKAREGAAVLASELRVHQLSTRVGWENGLNGLNERVSPACGPQTRHTAVLSAGRRWWR